MGWPCRWLSEAKREHPVVPTSSQDEALARHDVSREVPCSALKGETVPDSLPATPNSPPTRRVPPRGTPRVPAPLPLSPFSPPDTLVSLPLFIMSPAPLVEKAMAPHSSTLAWKIPWMEDPGRLQSMWSLRVGHDWVNSLSLFTFMHWRRKWQPTPVFLPGESQGRESLVGCRLWGHTELDTTEMT